MGHVSFREGARSKSEKSTLQSKGMNRSCIYLDLPNMCVTFGPKFIRKIYRMAEHLHKIQVYQGVCLIAGLIKGKPMVNKG